MKQTVGIAVFVSICFALWAATIVMVGYGGGQDGLWLARIVRDTISFSLPATVFFMAFAMLVEWTEEEQE